MMVGSLGVSFSRGFTIDRHRPRCQWRLRRRAARGRIIATMMCRRILPAVIVLWSLLSCGCAGPRPIRFATFDAALSHDKAGQLSANLLMPTDAQAQNVAE